jgi:HrpA-like RNA helicase
LDSDILGDKIVGVTQPRRVAAITVAQRVAEERNVTVGDEVGYSVRFDESTSNKTKIKFMTDGILVRECLRSPDLSQYQAIMLDEAHERSIHTDILFGLVKAACRKRPDLKVVITSATLDVTKFAAYFNSCPIVRVPG